MALFRDSEINVRKKISVTGVYLETRLIDIVLEVIRMEWRC